MTSASESESIRTKSVPDAGAPPARSGRPFETWTPTELPWIVLLPEPGRQELRCLSNEASSLAGRAIRLLEDLDPYAPTPTRHGQLALAVRALAVLEAHLPASLVPEETPARSPTQGYFRVRTADVEPAQVAPHVARVLHRSLADLAVAPVAAVTLARVATAAGELLRELGGDASRGGVPPRDLPTPDLTEGPQPFHHRWIIAHQLFASFALFAASAIERAVGSLEVDEPAAASRNLRRAATYTAGFSSARAHALAVPPAYYNQILRPSMSPPFSPAPLSGRMHVEYRAFRSAIARLLEASPRGLVDLASTDPELALAREGLLEADLLDAENHVALVESVVGSDRSLSQPAASPNNALAALRQIRDRRTAQVAPYVRGIAEARKRGN